METQTQDITVNAEVTPENTWGTLWSKEVHKSVIITVEVEIDGVITTQNVFLDESTSRQIASLHDRVHNR